MARDVMTVRLHLAQIRVLEVLEDTPGALRVSVESTLLRLRCPQCGFKCRRVHDRRDKKIRDLEVSGRRTVLVWSRRRMVCDNCDSRFLEDHPAFEGALTGRLARRLVADAKVMTFNAAARRHGVHWHGVRALVDTWSALVAERRRSRRCSVLLVDETSMRKRHRYVTVIVNGDTGRTLAMVEHRNSAALSAFLMQQGHRWCKGVKVVVSDGSKAYKSAIDAHLGHARHVLDRFHVIRWFAAGLTQVRRDVQRRPEGVKPAFDPEVFKARFKLLRRGDTLTDTSRSRIFLARRSCTRRHLNPHCGQRSLNNVDSTLTLSAPGVSSTTPSTRTCGKCSRTAITSEAIGALLDRGSDNHRFQQGPDPYSGTLNHPAPHVYAKAPKH